MDVPDRLTKTPYEMLEDQTEDRRLLLGEEGQLRSESKQLDDDIKALEREIEELENQIPLEERFANASSDARKMFGDVVPGDITHQDVILQYQNHFKEAFRNLPRSLGMEDKKYEVWQMVADIMMKSFEYNKEDIIEKMIEGMRNVLWDDSLMDENTADFYRAFKMLLEVPSIQSSLDDIEKEVTEELKQEHGYQNAEDASKFAREVITSLYASDYKSFIETGKRRGQTS